MLSHHVPRAFGKSTTVGVFKVFYCVFLSFNKGFVFLQSKVALKTKDAIVVSNHKMILPPVAVDPCLRHPMPSVWPVRPHLTHYVHIAIYGPRYGHAVHTHTHTYRIDTLN